MDKAIRGRWNVARLRPHVEHNPALKHYLDQIEADLTDCFDEWFYQTRTLPGGYLDAHYGLSDDLEYSNQIP